VRSGAPTQLGWTWRRSLCGSRPAQDSSHSMPVRRIPQMKIETPQIQRIHPMRNMEALRDTIATEEINKPAVKQPHVTFEPVS
jgi:hypothetical protein